MYLYEGFYTRAEHIELAWDYWDHDRGECPCCVQREHDMREPVVWPSN